MHIISSFLVMVFGFAQMAYAQDAAPAPAAELPATPLATQAAASGYFPNLPPARACTFDDLRSTTWRLIQVYENPMGEGIRDYQNNPFQYHLFFKNNVYKNYKSAKDIGGSDAWYRKLKNPEPVLQQFAMKDGFIYFYKAGAYTRTVACFIVANAKDEFAVGQMLLMPPAPQPGQAPAPRVMRSYKKVVFPPSPPVRRPPPPKKQ